jgi:hypothetical protein
MTKEECNEVGGVLGMTAEFLGSLSFPVRSKQHDIALALLRKLDSVENILRKEAQGITQGVKSPERTETDEPST